ncbi:MAG: hypothetical protein ACI9BD_000592 [Candidatus Marinamargulisbacteria bacterium]|jgi:hypothetical protein
MLVDELPLRTPGQRESVDAEISAAGEKRSFAAQLLVDGTVDTGSKLRWESSASRDVGMPDFSKMEKIIEVQERRALASDEASLKALLIELVAEGVEFEVLTAAGFLGEDVAYTEAEIGPNRIPELIKDGKSISQLIADGFNPKAVVAAKAEIDLIKEDLGKGCPESDAMSRHSMVLLKACYSPEELEAGQRYNGLMSEMDDVFRESAPLMAMICRASPNDEAIDKQLSGMDENLLRLQTNMDLLMADEFNSESPIIAVERDSFSAKIQKFLDAKAEASEMRQLYTSLTGELDVGETSRADILKGFLNRDIYPGVLKALGFKPSEVAIAKKELKVEAELDQLQEKVSTLSPSEDIFALGKALDSLSFSKDSMKPTGRAKFDSVHRSFIDSTGVNKYWIQGHKRFQAQMAKLRNAETLMVGFDSPPVAGKELTLEQQQDFREAQDARVSKLFNFYQEVELQLKELETLASDLGSGFSDKEVTTTLDEGRLTSQVEPSTFIDEFENLRDLIEDQELRTLGPEPFLSL